MCWSRLPLLRCLLACVASEAWLPLRGRGKSGDGALAVPRRVSPCRVGEARARDGRGRAGVEDNDGARIGWSHRQTGRASGLRSARQSVMDVGG
jgi:hypothetical protein